MPDVPRADDIPTPDVVEMKGIVKRFPGVVALDKVDFAAAPRRSTRPARRERRGQEHAHQSAERRLRGGRGRDLGSTGSRLSIQSPQDSLDHGHALHLPGTQPGAAARHRPQHLSGDRADARGRAGRHANALRARRPSCSSASTSTWTRAKLVSTLSVTQQKMVEIARALTTQVKVIILDEPTDVLEDRSRQGPVPADRRAQDGPQREPSSTSRTVTAEVYEVGDRVTILRDGQNVGTFDIKGSAVRHDDREDDRRAGQATVPGAARTVDRRTRCASRG